MRSTLLATLLFLVSCEGMIVGPVDPADPDPDVPPPEELGPAISIDFTESDADLFNPERGFYVGYDLVDADDAGSIRARGHTVAIALVNLAAYRDRPLDLPLLSALNEGFAQVRAAGVKLILRFTYNAAFDEDASLTQILGHIEQLTPILQDNADVISVLQAGFIGAWGEWHGSTHGLDRDPAARAAVLDALLSALPSSRGVQVRTPMFKDAYVPGGPLGDEEAYDGSPRARIGHHNDCFLASDTDLGTYDDPVDHWQAYVADDGRFTAIGGETCRVYKPRSTCDSAVAAMTAQHWSYLNSQYHLDVLQSWIDGGCAGPIAQRLGYRFALDRFAHTAAIAPGGVLAIEITLHNSGFAAPYNRRPVEIVLRDGATARAVRLADLDARRWAPGASATVRALLRVPADLPAGSYTLALRLPDDDARLAGDPRYAIQLANDGIWDDAAGENVLTRALQIDPDAPGPIDPDASSFAQIQ